MRLGRPVVFGVVRAFCLFFVRARAGRLVGVRGLPSPWPSPPHRFRDWGAATPAMTLTRFFASFRMGIMAKKSWFFSWAEWPLPAKIGAGRELHEFFYSSQASLVELVQYKEVEHTMNKELCANIPNSFWPLFPSALIEDPASLYLVVVFGSRTRAIPWRHLKAPAGVAAPRSRNQLGGEDCLSEASSAALNFGTGAKAPGGPRPGANGFGSFCRNKRTASCGAAAPQIKPRKTLPLVVRSRDPAKPPAPPFLYPPPPQRL